MWQPSNGPVNTVPRAGCAAPTLCGAGGLMLVSRVAVWYISNLDTAASTAGVYISKSGLCGL